MTRAVAVGENEVNSLEKIQGKGQFMKRNWEELKKSGGIALPISDIKAILEEGDVEMLNREEVLERITNYFNSCLRIAIDENTGEQVPTWVRNPTKSGLALALGVDAQTLIDYVKGVNSTGRGFSWTNPDAKRVVSNEDFDIVRKAYALIESFYEEKLGDNRNNAGVIYWLNNTANSKWSNEQEFKFGTIEYDHRRVLSAAELPKLRTIEDEE